MSTKFATSSPAFDGFGGVERVFAAVRKVLMHRPAGGGRRSYQKGLYIPALLASNLAARLLGELE